MKKLVAINLSKLQTNTTFVIATAMVITLLSACAGNAQRPLPTPAPRTVDVETYYDNYKARTEVSASRKTQQRPLYCFEQKAPECINVMFGVYYPGSKLERRPETYHVVVTSGSRSWLYLRCPRTEFLVNGAKIATGISHHDGEVHTGYVTESITTPIPASSIDMMANAQSISMRICGVEYAFDNEEMVGLRKFATLTTPVNAAKMVSKEEILAVMFTFNGHATIQVFDRNGQVLAAKSGADGIKEVVEGTAPLEVFVSDPMAVVVTVNGVVLPITANLNGGAARFRLANE